MEFFDAQLAAPRRADRPARHRLTHPACSPCTASAPTPPPLLLVAAGDEPARLRSEAAWAHLCAVAPIPASSGKVTRHRFNPGGDRQANHALWRIVITRMSAHPPTRHLRRAAHRRRPVQERDHPLPQALRRPRGLPPPARRPAGNPQTPGTALTSNRLPHPCWPANDSSAVPGPNPDLRWP